MNAFLSLLQDYAPGIAQAMNEKEVKLKTNSIPYTHIVFWLFNIEYQQTENPVKYLSTLQIPGHIELPSTEIRQEVYLAQ